MRPGKRQLIRQMMVGAGVILFGLACPLFWNSLLSGNSGPEIIDHGIHSGVFIMAGLFLLGTGWYDLNCMRDHYNERKVGL